MNKKRICLLTSGHLPFDERIFWKFGITLVENKFDVMVVSSTEEMRIERKGIKVNSFDGINLDKRKKIEVYFNLLQDFNPQVIICSEPLPVIAAAKYRRKQKNHVEVILDVTE